MIVRALGAERRGSFVPTDYPRLLRADWLRNASWSSVPVTSDTALEVPAVAACVHGIAGAVSTLTLYGYRSLGGEKVPMDTLPRLWREPSADLAPEDWIYTHIQAQILDGCAWGRIVARDARMNPTQVELVPADVVQVRHDRSSGDFVFMVDRQVVPRADLWIAPGVPSRVSRFGASLVERMRRPIARYLMADDYLSQFFRDGAHPTALLETEVDPGVDGARALKAKLLELRRGNREPLVMPKGVKLTPFQVNPQQASVVEVMRQCATDIATHLLTPPEMAGGETGKSMTYANVEQQQIMLLQRAVRYWLRKIELPLSRAVMPRTIEAKFDENELVRMDLRTKVDAIVAATGGPFLTMNEGREMDDREPLDGGDVVAAPAPGVM